jgi:hypothetical protein
MNSAVVVAAAIIGLAILAHASQLPRYQIIDSATLDVRTGEVCFMQGNVVALWTCDKGIEGGD